MGATSKYLMALDVPHNLIGSPPVRPHDVHFGSFVGSRTWTDEKRKGRSQRNPPSGTAPPCITDLLLPLLHDVCRAEREKGETGAWLPALHRLYVADRLRCAVASAERALRSCPTLLLGCLHSGVISKCLSNSRMLAPAFRLFQSQSLQRLSERKRRRSAQPNRTFKAPRSRRSWPKS